MKNVKYRIDREKLIPQAEAYANSKSKGYVRKYSKSGDSLPKSDFWNFHFHTEMERLYKKSFSKKET